MLLAKCQRFCLFSPFLAISQRFSEFLYHLPLLGFPPTHLNSEVIGLSPLHVYFWQQLVIDPPDDGVVRGWIAGDCCVALDPARRSQVRNQQVHAPNRGLLPHLFRVGILKPGKDVKTL